MSAPRERMLARIATALGPSARAPSIPREYRGASGATEAGSPALVGRFCDTVADYGAGIWKCARGEIEAAIEAACSARGTERITVAGGITWPTPGVDSVRDDPDAGIEELAGAEAALTGCALAIAETGTIVLDGSPRCGRRALTLIPDHHLCVVDAEQVVAGLPEAVAGLHAAAREGRPLTFVSGPSATSDIELQRVEGVHGPRQMDVIVVGAAG